jgi:hypothetical protein
MVSFPSTDNFTPKTNVNKGKYTSVDAWSTMCSRYYLRQLSCSIIGSEVILAQGKGRVGPQATQAKTRGVRKFLNIYLRKKLFAWGVAHS